MLAFCKLCHDRRAAIIYWLVNLRFPEYTGYTTTCLLDVGVTISGLWLIFSMMDRECGFRHRFVGRVLYGWHYVDGFPREEIRICKHARSKYGWNGKLEFPVRRHWNFIFNRNKTKYFFFFFFLNIQKCFYESNIFRTMIKVTMLSLLKIYFDAICKEECIFEEIYLFFI